MAAHTWSKRLHVFNTTCMQALLQKRTRGTGSMELQIWLMWCNVISCDADSLPAVTTSRSLGWLFSRHQPPGGRESNGVTRSTSLSSLLCAAPLTDGNGHVGPPQVWTRQLILQHHGGSQSERKNRLSPVRCSQTSVDSFEGQFTYRRKYSSYGVEGNRQDTHQCYPYHIFHEVATTKTFTDYERGDTQSFQLAKLLYVTYRADHLLVNATCRGWKEASDLGGRCRGESWNTQAVDLNTTEQVVE